MAPLYIADYRIPALKKELVESPAFSEVKCKPSENVPSEIHLRIERKAVLSIYFFKNESLAKEDCSFVVLSAMGSGSEALLPIISSFCFEGPANWLQKSSFIFKPLFWILELFESRAKKESSLRLALDHFDGL